MEILPEFPERVLLYPSGQSRDRSVGGLEKSTEKSTIQQINQPYTTTTIITSLDSPACHNCSDALTLMDLFEIEWILGIKHRSLIMRTRLVHVQPYPIKVDFLRKILKRLVPHPCHFRMEPIGIYSDSRPYFAIVIRAIGVFDPHVFLDTSFE